MAKKTAKCSSANTRGSQHIRGAAILKIRRTSRAKRANLRKPVVRFVAVRWHFLNCGRASELYFRKQVATQKEQDRGQRRKDGEIGGSAEVTDADQSRPQSIHAIRKGITNGDDFQQLGHVGQRKK